MGQQDKGIHFERNLNWQDVLSKAKNEDKYIFVDCYTTWCKPCREMETVYLNEEVAKYFNEKFISVKVQMDVSKQDNSEIKSWYDDANKIRSKYNVSAFPTFLFFSSTGTLMHRGIGVLSVENLIALGSDALDPKKQFYKLLDDYQKGKKDYTLMPYLVKIARINNSADIAEIIAQDYANNYLLLLPEENLYTKENLYFLSVYTQASKDKGFYIFYNNRDRINKIMNHGKFVETIINNIIIREEVMPIFDSVKKIDKEPNWKKIFETVKVKYDKRSAKWAIADSKLQWYKFQNDWSNYTKCLVNRVKKFGPIGIGVYDFDLNNNAFDVFLHSSDKYELSKALEWSDQTIKINNDSNIANWMDTKANILYKLGKINKAIEVEERAVKIAPNSAEFQNNLQKMRMGEPTWSNK